MTNLVESLKKKMNYISSEVDVCVKCKYCDERENPHLDRSWMHWCTFNKIKSFQVNQRGRCKYFEKRDS